MTHASWMIERLVAETRGHHAAADTELDPLFAPDVSSADYLQYLMRIYGFAAPFEVMLSVTPNLELMVDLHERKKAGYAARDLLALGLRPVELEQVPRCTLIPQLRGAAEALGWMFVVERSTLSHSVIRRHLTTRLPREVGVASAYLSCYATIVGTRWRQFGATLDLMARHPSIADRIVSAAHAAFDCQRVWMHGRARGLIATGTGTLAPLAV